MFVDIPTPELDKITLPNWITKIDYKPLQMVEINTLLNNEVWVTAYRQQIPVREMSTSHINNCIKCILGKGKSIIPKDYLGGHDKWLKIFNNELINRN